MYTGTYLCQGASEETGPQFVCRCRCRRLGVGVLSVRLLFMRLSAVVMAVALAVRWLSVDWPIPRSIVTVITSSKALVSVMLPMRLNIKSRRTQCCLSEWKVFFLCGKRLCATCCTYSWWRCLGFLTWRNHLESGSFRACNLHTRTF